MRVLVTGGAGLIGSHVADELLRRGHEVRVLDSLELPTHASGEPTFVPQAAQFLRGDVRDPATVAVALDGVDAVAHLAATGGFTADVARYFRVNTLGTATLLDQLRARGRAGAPIRKLVVASSVGIYGESRYRDRSGAWRDIALRSAEQLDAGRWDPEDPATHEPLLHAPVDESKAPCPGNPYCISKFDQERLVLQFGAEEGVESLALRYFLTYGPRQSLTNPYTGIVSIFATRILNGLRPVVFEDGRQLRDLVFVEDVARATCDALESEGVTGEALNIGTGVGTEVREVARLLAQSLGRPELAPELPGAWRPGESRHLYANIEKARRLLGWQPRVSLEEGLGRTVGWLRAQARPDERFSGALADLRRQQVVRGAPSAAEAGATAQSEDPDAVPYEAEAAPAPSLSVVVPAWNEAGNLEQLVRRCQEVLPGFTRRFEVILVDDGSRDGTREIADRLAGEDPRVRAIHHPFNLGYGAAQKSGFDVATCEWVALVPADNQFDVADLERYLAVSADADVVGGVRVDRKEAWDRRLVSGVFNRLLRSLYGVELSDVNWVKMFRRELLRQIDLETPGFTADAEVIVKICALGARVTELPVAHHPRTWGEETQVSVHNVTRTLREIVGMPAKLRRYRRGRGPRPPRGRG